MREPEEYADAPEHCSRCGAIDPCRCNVHPQIPTAVRERTMSDEQKARRAEWLAGL